jgi:hypothetical protein
MDERKPGHSGRERNGRTLNRHRKIVIGNQKTVILRNQ